PGAEQTGGEAVPGEQLPGIEPPARCQLEQHADQHAADGAEQDQVHGREASAVWARIIGIRWYSAMSRPIYNSLIPNNNGYRQMAQRHIFVIGCSRSGTSLVQKKVAEHCGLWTLPETEFFL